MANGDFVFRIDADGFADTTRAIRALERQFAVRNRFGEYWRILYREVGRALRRVVRQLPKMPSADKTLLKGKFLTKTLAKITAGEFVPSSFGGRTLGVLRYFTPRLTLHRLGYAVNLRRQRAYRKGDKARGRKRVLTPRIATGKMGRERASDEEARLAGRSYKAQGAKKGWALAKPYPLPPGAHIVAGRIYASPGGAPIKIDRRRSLAAVFNEAAALASSDLGKEAARQFIRSASFVLNRKRGRKSNARTN